MYHFEKQFSVLLACVLIIFLTACDNSTINREKHSASNSGNPVERPLVKEPAESRNAAEESRLPTSILSQINIPASPSPGTFDQATYDALGAPELAYGGLLYDKWFVAGAAAGATTPTAAHPLWPNPPPPTVEDTWRCKECHGWDYAGADGAYGTDPASIHFSGLCGVLDTANCTTSFSAAADTLWTFIHDGGATAGIANPVDHSFAADLQDAEIYALTKFIMTIRTEAADGMAPSSFIDTDPASPTFAKATADQGRGLKFYSIPSTFGGCSESCHGDDGKLIDIKPPNELFIDEVANDNPWEVLHKIRFGNPGTTPPMPGTVQYGNPEFNVVSAADVLAYVQTALGRSNERGGRLFDNWIVESGSAAPGPNPLMALAPSPGGATDAESWQCAVCHGFDYEGGRFGFSNNLVELKEVNSWDMSKVYGVLKNGYSAVNPADGTLTVFHNYSDHLSDLALWDLAAFAMKNIIDMHEFIRVDTGGIRAYKADAVEGGEIYNGDKPGTFATGDPVDCVTCHGPQGKLTGADIFSLSWRDPFKFFHRTAFGTPRDPAAAPASFSPSLYDANVVGGHIDDHEIADVVYFVQESLITLSPATVTEILQQKAAENKP